MAAGTDELAADFDEGAGADGANRIPLHAIAQVAALRIARGS
jgi:hypothetical protein